MQTEPTQPSAETYAKVLGSSHVRVFEEYREADGTLSTFLVDEHQA